MKHISILIAALIISGCTTSPTPQPTAEPVPTSAATAAPEATDTAVPSPTVEVIEIQSETLDTLDSEEVPKASLRELARRLGGVTEDIPDMLDPPAAPLQIGAKDIFHASNQDTNEQFDVNATLRYITDHAYFWIGDGAQYNEDDLERLALAFENRIYPVTRDFFGSEPNPGIDGDPHIYILYANGFGFGIAGYFSSVDSQHPLVREDSNGHEMFYFNASTVELDEEFTYAVLAHEFQHMVNFNVDLDETTWVSEGLAELSAHLNGYGTAVNHPLYTDDPDRSLNDWDPDDAGPNYGAASLYMYYFYDRFGEAMTKQMATHPGNGLEGIDLAFEDAEAMDPVTGELYGADGTILDWVIANYLDDKEVADGRFSYHAFSELRQTRQTETLLDCPAEEEERQVSQYGVHYIRLICQGQRTLSFDGVEEIPLLPADPYSGNYSFWSNKGDTADMRLTQAFDLTGVTGPVSLTYQTWYDIEENWDYVFLVVSEDSGESWEILRTPSSTDRNPNSNSYGWGYTGESRLSDWIEETVDLSEYAGKEVVLRFEYVTDLAANGEGMLLDDISIPEIGYFSDFEIDDGGWEAEGWVRVQNELPQTFRLAWISLGDETTVEYIPLGAGNTAQISIDITEDKPGVLVVVPTTRITRQPASYTYSFSE
jgi:immune inhibitor A